MSHIWMRHVIAHMNESRLTYECITSHRNLSRLDPLLWRMSHVSHMDESCRTCGWITSHIWTSHVAQEFIASRSAGAEDASCLTYECVMSHTWMRHVAHMNASCRTYKWVTSHVWTSHVAQEFIASRFASAEADTHGNPWCQRAVPLHGHVARYLCLACWRYGVCRTIKLNRSTEPYILHLNPRPSATACFVLTLLVMLEIWCVPTHWTLHVEDMVCAETLN